MLAAGDAFLLPLGDDPTIKHLFVVISDPSQDAQRVVFVNVTSWEEGKDDACFLDPAYWAAACPFIQHESCIEYRRARAVPSSMIEKWFEDGVAERRDNVGPQLLRKILEGAQESRFLPNNCILILADQGLIRL